MKKLVLLIILFFAFLILHSFSFAQNKNIDSLLTLIKNNNPDTINTIHKINLSKQYQIIGKYNEALKYAQEAKEQSLKLNYKKGLGNSYNTIGDVNWYKGKYALSYDNYFNAIQIFEKLNNKIGIADCNRNIGWIYFNEKNDEKALEYFTKSLVINLELNRKNSIASNYDDFGILYSRQHNFEIALNYYFMELNTIDQANKSLISSPLTNIGNLYDEQKDYPKALDFYFKALKIKEEIGNKIGVAGLLYNIGTVYMVTGKYKEAEQYIKKAISINTSIDALDELRINEESLSELYDTTGRHKEALVHYKKAVALKDSIFSQENKKELVRKEMNYEFDKKEAATKAENEKLQAIAEEKNRKQKLVLVLVSCVLILVFVFAGFIFRSLRITRKQKQIIVLKNTETEQQKIIIEEKNKDITDSIRYAKRIQDALMGEKVHVSAHLPEHFILFIPKDIVSGDFHWGVEKQGYWYFAAVDCTGHGVPGAVMSMLGISFLNDIVLSEKLLAPAEVLNRLRDKVIKELRQTGEEGGSKDGMDISLCRLNLTTNELQWAGAYNPLNLFRNGQLEELKADKQPIGYHTQSRPFTNHEIQLQKGDRIYISTDGFADQFGGPKGKKFKYKQLEDLISTNSHLPLKNQKEILKKNFIDWRGTLEQVDDVCVFGVKV